MWFSVIKTKTNNRTIPNLKSGTDQDSQLCLHEIIIFFLECLIKVKETSETW